MKTMDIDSLRVLCVLRGEEVLYFFHTFSVHQLRLGIPIIVSQAVAVGLAAP